MKTRLSIESLEDRRNLSGWTVTISDPSDLVSADVERKMWSCTRYAMENIARYASWNGTLDARVELRPSDPSYPGGIAWAIMNVFPDRRNAVLNEMQTGIDSNQAAPDVGATFSVASDGKLKIWGLPAYFDPEPRQYVPASVPPGHFDFIGVMTHEIFHGLGIQSSAEFLKHVTNVNGLRYFNGPNTVAALGRPLPMSPTGGTHYGNTSLPNNPISSGLMFQWGNYEGNRLDIGRLDLMILKDTGINVYNTAGLPLVDLTDSQAPITTVSRRSVYENVNVGTLVGTFNTNLGCDGYSWQLVAGMDSSAFRIVGRNLVTNAPLDYEQKISYTFTVRCIDTKGVWTDSFMTVNVADVAEPPTVVMPAVAYVTNGSTNMGMVAVIGDQKFTPTIMIFSRGGTFENRVSDPSVQVVLTTNKYGGMTIFLTGKPSALTRSLKNVTYRGSQSSLSFQLCATGTNYGSWTMGLRY